MLSGTHTEYLLLTNNLITSLQIINSWLTLARQNLSHGKFLCLYTVLNMHYFLTILYEHLENQS